MAVQRSRTFASLLRRHRDAAGLTQQELAERAKPGVRKTRLAQEAGVRAWERRFVVAAGRCYEAHSGVPFYPFLDALCMLHEEAPPKIREAIPARWPCLARLLPDHFPSRPAASSE